MPQRRKRRTSLCSPRRDHAREAVDAIIALLEQGVRPWRCPWAQTVGLPRRSNGEAYRGINVVLLLGRAARQGWSNPYWFTYKQAEGCSAQVRTGSKATPVYYYGTAETEDEEDTKRRKFLKVYHVFNAAQIDRLPDRYDIIPSQDPGQHSGSDEVPEAVPAYFAAIPVRIEHGGARAFYRPATDMIGMPPIAAFSRQSLYWSTLAHEVGHWTGGPGRLNRSFGSAFGDHSYAAEELVAELVSVLIGGQLGLPADHLDDHAAYLGHWIAAMKEDRTILFKAAAQAQIAVDHMNSYQPKEAGQPVPAVA